MDRLLRDRPERRTKHLCTNIIIEFDGPEGTATSDYAMLAREGDGAWSVVSLGRYRDRLVRRAEGTGWQFAERRLTVA
jgi:3-phenylpropionate/cinnamic acid dioxygenase small subunit